MKKKKMGFTLVELLAVIVILTVILVIAVPRITEVIENSKKATFESSAKTIAASAEKRKMENDLLENTDTISCNDVVSLNDTDYLSCSITFDGDTAKVSMIGSGKFEGLLINEGTKDNATADASYVANYIKFLYNDENLRTKNGLKIDNTVDANIRYYGVDPKNYVKFKDSDEVWRIIGIFNDYVKLVKKERLENGRKWSIGVSSVNKGGGVNQWGKSTYESGEVYAGAYMQLYLNGEYYNSLSNITKSSIDYHLWNTAGVNPDLKINTVEFYNAERGTMTGKECISSDWCNDTVNRTTTWNGFIALLYPTDWAYASATDGCDANMQQQISGVFTCKNDNWLHSGSKIWFLSPYISSTAKDVWRLGENGFINYDGCGDNYMAVFPAVYLKSNVKIVNGSGLSTDPYILDIE